MCQGNIKNVTKKVVTEKHLKCYKEKKTVGKKIFWRQKNIFGDKKNIFGDKKNTGDKKNIFGDKKNTGDKKNIFGDKKNIFGDEKNGILSKIVEIRRSKMLD